MAGVPGVYIEASYRGHKASPGRYRFTLKLGERTVTAEAAILANPVHTTDAATYAEYSDFMSGAERELSSMHETTNQLYKIQGRLTTVLAGLPAGERYAGLKREGDSPVAKLKAWDADMVSRKTRVYDDAENYPQKFTANYLFLINATESDLPRVNQPSRDRRTELIGIAVLKAGPTLCSTGRSPRSIEGCGTGFGAIGENRSAISWRRTTCSLTWGPDFTDNRFEKHTTNCTRSWTKKVRQLFRMSAKATSPSGRLSTVFVQGPGNN